MAEDAKPSNARDDELASWSRIGIAAGFLACFAYPLMVYVPLPRIPQVIFGASFGPALAVPSVALAHILEARRRAASVELAGICNSVAGALVTAMKALAEWPDNNQMQRTSPAQATERRR